MHIVLKKRVLRDLKSNLPRWLALFGLIVLAMYMVIGIVGAAQKVIVSVDQGAKRNQREDGNFTVFIPLKDSELADIGENGVTIEKIFYLDYKLENDSTVRVYQDRQRINLLELKQGSLPLNLGELVVEEQYAAQHGLHLGDSFKLGDISLTITGIATTPDYDNVLQEVSSTSSDSSMFGIVFVCEEQYEALREAGSASKSEIYAYSYLLGDNMTDEELKDYLTNLSFDQSAVEDVYFREMMDTYTEKKTEIEDGIKELADGAGELMDGLEEIAGHNDELLDGYHEIFDAYLAIAAQQLSEYGIEETITEENYQEVLTRLMGTKGDEIVRSRFQEALDGLQALGEYQEALNTYTDAVNEAADGSKELKDGIDLLEEKTNELIDEIFTYEADNLVQFMKAENNPRIAASAYDKIIDKYAGMMAGVIVMILFTYIISVFVLHSIECEEPIIGTFYALGVNKNTLVRHYLTLPLLVTVFGCIVGTILGFSPLGVGYFTGTSSEYFSLPLLVDVYPAYLLIYGLVMPPLIALAVNYLVINKKLAQPVLKLMRKESHNGKQLKLRFKHLGYIRTFQIHQFFREFRSGLTILFGMFIALLVFMLGMNCYVLCKNIEVQNKEDANFKYIYTFKYPEENVPEGGTGFYQESLNKEAYGYDLNVSLCGMENGNDYFDTIVPQAKNAVVISDSVAVKFQLKTGDKLILTDEVANQDYAFTVEAITHYSIGLYVFMDIDSMRELFGQDEDYYNVVYANQELDIDSGRLYAVLSKEDVEKSAEVFINSMWPLVFIMIGISIPVFMIVMYLMMKVMIDRSAHNISMMKVFGYRKREIKKLYLDGNFFWIIVSAIICIPGSKYVMDLLYPTLISNTNVGGDLTITWKMYLMILLGVMICYFIINLLLVKRLNYFLPADILKDRDEVG